MASNISFILKFIHQYDQPMLEHSPSTGLLPNCLLSPITEMSAEILSITLPTNRTSADPSHTVLTNDNSTIDELNQILLQKFHQHTTHLHHLQTYLNTLDEHFTALSFILKHLQHDQSLTDLIELLQTRLLQMRVKRDQIDRLLNQSFTFNLIEQISPLIFKSKSVIDYNELFSSVQLSINQKTVLIDHLRNDYRYRKYQINEYSSKFQRRQDLLLKLIRQIEEYLAQHEKQTKEVNHIFIFNEHNRQCTELMNLSHEYEQVQHENQLLTLKAKQNLHRLSLLMQSNDH